MSQTALNLAAIAVFCVTLSILAGPLINLSPVIPAALTAGLLGLTTVDVLGFNSRGVTLLMDALASKEERERIVYHEAGHFLAAYCLGIPITGYTLTAWDAFRQGQPGRGGVSFDLAALSATSSRDFPLLLERFATVLMAGIAAETFLGDRGEGGDDDRRKLREALQLAGFPAKLCAQKESWALLQAKNLLMRQRPAYEALVKAMQERSSVADCYRIVQQALV